MNKRSVWSTACLGAAAVAVSASAAMAAPAPAPGRTLLDCEGRKGSYAFSITDEPLTLDIRRGPEWVNYFDNIENIAGSVFSTYDFAKTDVGYKFDRKETSRASGRIYQTYEVRFDLKAMTFTMIPAGILPLTEGISDQGRCKAAAAAELK